MAGGGGGGDDVAGRGEEARFDATALREEPGSAALRVTALWDLASHALVCCCLQALDGCQQHIEALRSSATALVGGSSSGSADPNAAEAGEGQQQLPVLYDAAALQLWLLKCCQVVSCQCWFVKQGTAAAANCSPLPLLPTSPPLSPTLQLPRGGLRDKPGKSADYYHTCYCLRWVWVWCDVRAAGWVVCVSGHQRWKCCLLPVATAAPHRQAPPRCRHLGAAVG